MQLITHDLILYKKCTCTPSAGNMIIGNLFACQGFDYKETEPITGRAVNITMPVRNNELLRHVLLFELLYQPHGTIRCCDMLATLCH